MNNEQTKDNIKPDEYDKYYSYEWYCSNCGKRTHRYIKKGIPVKEIYIPCDNCGCSLNRGYYGR